MNRGSEGQRTLDRTSPTADETRESVLRALSQPPQTLRNEESIKEQIF